MSFGCAVFQVGGSERERLLNVSGLEFRIVAEEIFAIWIERHCLDDSSDGQPHASNAWLAVHLVGIPSDSIKALHLVLFSYILAARIQRRVVRGQRPE